MPNVSRFLSMLEEEIYGENSPIWEADFTVPASDGTQLGHQTGMVDSPPAELIYFFFFLSPPVLCGCVA